MLMYQTLSTGSKITTWVGDSDFSSEWTSMAAKLKTAVNSMNDDAAAGQAPFSLD
jgi:hypothetical protein